MSAGLRVGDYGVALLGLALIGVLALQRPTGDGRLVVRQAGQVFKAVDARLNQEIRVPGPLGITVVEVRDGRVRVASDPSPRQLCVRQGWLGAGEAALCLPNRVSVEWGRLAYDSLGY
ncbi:MAG: hypothetical protein D4R70_03775 [Betaproteobacteria bacterium]|nr:MAG: hypothetical protein D4R70_03775 [Betaproteobacteria bacterium]